MKHSSLLLELKLTILKNHFKKFLKRSPLETITLLIFLTGAGFGLYYFFNQSFQFFQAQEPFGPILVEEVFYLFNFAIFIMLLISSGVSAYTALYKSGEVPFLITRPVSWPEIYFIKLAENMWHSSWALLFIMIPFMAGYGAIKNVGLLFPLLCLTFYIPFVILTATLGMFFSTLTVWFLPSKKRRNFALLLVVALIIYWFSKAQPEFIKEQGSLAGILSGYLPHVGFAKSPLQPSYWVTRGILLLSDVAHLTPNLWWEGTFYLLILLSNTFFFLIPSYSVASILYPATFFKSQDYGEERKTKRILIRSKFETFLDKLKWPSPPGLAFLEKDIKTFARDPSEWSQLFIFFGLLIIYFANLKNLEFHVLKDFWKNMVFVLNTVGTYIVLSSFSMRFVFPMLSLEGSRAWMIGLAPIRFSSILLVKFLLGTVASVCLTLPLVFFSGWMLNISLIKILFTAGLGIFVCVALTGLSVGFGAKFPNFKSNNPAEIISGFGGSLLLVTHLIYLGLIGVFLFFSKEPNGIILLTVAAGSLLVGVIPIKIGIMSLKKMEF